MFKKAMVRRMTAGCGEGTDLGGAGDSVLNVPAAGAVWVREQTQAVQVTGER